MRRFSLVILVLAGIANGFLIYVLARNITGSADGAGRGRPTGWPAAAWTWS